MFKFFSNQYDLIKLKILKNKVASLRDAYNKAAAEQRDTANKLSQEQNALSNLENQCLNFKVDRTHKEQELQSIDLQRDQINKHYHQSINELERANRLKDESESKLSHFKAQFNIQSIREQIGALNKKLQFYDNIIAQPEPEPQYELDGEYCINGIYHCQNHPPRQVLINEDAIKQHRQAVDDALKQREKISDELQKLRQECSELEQIESSLQASYKAAMEYFELCQQNAEDLQQEVTEIDSLYNQTSLELENIKQEENRLKIAIENTQARICSLEIELSKQEAEVENSQYLLSEAEHELERAIAEHEALIAKFQSLAMDELSNEGINIDNSTISNLTSTLVDGYNQAGDWANTQINNGLQRVENMAESVTDDYNKAKDWAHNKIDKEVKDAEEGKPDNFIERAADKLMDYAIDTAEEAGAISKQVKKNLNAIRNFFDNEVRKQEQKAYETMDQIVEPPNYDQTYKR